MDNPKAHPFRPQRSAIRAYAKGKSIYVHTHADRLCRNLLELERNPHSTHMAERAMKSLLGMIEAE